MNTFQLKTNAIMFTHNDLDGIGCGILFKAAIGYNAEVHYCGYYNVDEKINARLDELQAEGQTPQIVISDLGIKPETAERLDRYAGEKFMLDHHKTNRWIDEQFDWAIIDEEASGTLLVFDRVEGIPEKYRDFAIRVDDYDRWVHNYPDSKQLNRLFFILGIDRFEDRCLKAANPIEFTDVDNLLLELEDDNIDRYINKLEKGIKVYEFSGDRKVGIVFADHYQSEAGHELMNRLELDAIALIDANYRKISFRSEPHFDVGEIAKRLGGGGHKNAAGVEFNYGRIDDFHGHKYPLFEFFDSFNRTVFELFWKFKNVFESIENEAIEEMFKGAK